MSVHWNRTEAGTTKEFVGKDIKHHKAYCHCPDGKCESGFQTPPKKEIKKHNNLAARQASYDAMRVQDRHGMKRPGSNKK